MATSVQFRPQNRDLGMVMREVDEDLAIFLGIRNVEMEKNEHLLDEESLGIRNVEMEKNEHLLDEESHQFDDDDLKCEKPQPDSLLTLKASQAETCLVVADDNFLDLEMEMSDHDWLLKQPDSSLLPSLNADEQDSAAAQIKVSNGEDIPLKSELDVITASVSESSSPLATLSTSRPTSEGKPRCSRASTPTARPSLAAKSRPSRASTPTSRPTLLPSSKPAAQPRSSTPVRPVSRSSTPASRPSAPIVSKSGPRSATPTRKPAIVSRGTSPMVKSRSSKPMNSLSSSQDADQNVKVSMPKRPVSASRGRVSSCSSSSSNEKPRQKSCSPARVRAPVSAAQKSGSKVLTRSRGYNSVEDDVNPVVLGTKMVDRVVNMRKLAPPKQDECVSQENPRKSSQENSGFGRSLSKKSLEMAMRHMDIRPRVPGKSRTSAAGGSVCGIRSGCAKISTAAAPESPQTSNSDSSKSSSCRSSYFLNGADMDDSTC